MSGSNSSLDDVFMTHDYTVNSDLHRCEAKTGRKGLVGEL
jgi:hypothetical protein